MVAWPFIWINNTFATRAKTEELLRPELEHTLTAGDFEKAVNFFPGKQQHYQTAYALAASSVVTAYGVFYRKPPWPIRRGLIMGGLSGFGGSVLGQFMRIRAHAQFVRSLDDREGFISAINNVRERGALDIRQPNTNDFGDMVEKMSQKAPEATPVASSDDVTINRWDAIRTANARSAGRNSTWDTLRQNHEREKVVGIDEASSTNESDRAREQAQFDAMLEAERRAENRTE